MSAAAKAVFEADSSKLDSALLRVQQSMLKLQKMVAMVHYGFAALKAVGNLISKEFEHVKESMTLGKELNELSARTGIAVGDLVELRSEFKKVGKDAPTASFAAYKQRTGADPRVFSFDLAGYGTLQFPERNVFTLAGFSDKALQTMRFLEDDQSALLREIEAIEL